MARYIVKIPITGTNINTVRKQIAAAFPGQEHRVENANPEKSRADRLAAAEALRDEAKEIVETLKDELQEWHDSIPDNLKNSDKAEQVEEARSELERIEGELEAIDFSSISFPGIH